jgi:hypothetical protein
MQLARQIRILSGFLACLGGFAAEVKCDELAIPAPGRVGWQPLTFPKVRKHTVYTPLAIDGREAIRAESRCSASALIYPLEGIDLAKMRWLAWEWKVESAVQVSDHRVKAGDDFAARVYLVFEFEPEVASAWERLRRRALGAVFGFELPGNALNYVWSAREPTGAAWDSPFTQASKLISRGNARGWRREEVNVLEDYRRSFGAPPPSVVALALMSDSDNSCQAAKAYFANFRFMSR